MSSSSLELQVCDLCEQNFTQSIAITLPCGFVVCKSHLDNQNTDKLTCIVCLDHEIKLNECFNLQKNKQKIKQFELKAKNEYLEEKLEKLETLKLDPGFHVSQSYEELKRTLNLRREELKLDIDKYYTDLLQKIELDQQECLRNLNSKLNSLDVNTAKQAKNAFVQEYLGNKNLKGNYLNNLQKALDELQILVNPIESIEKCLERPLKHELKVDKQILMEKLFGELKLEPVQEEINFVNKFKGKCVLTLTGHSSFVYSVRVLNNKEILSCSDDKTIKYWDKSSGQCIRTLEGHQARITCMELTDNDEILTGSLDKTIKIWKNGLCFRSLEGHSDSICCLISLGDLIISASADSKIKVWQKVLGLCLKTLEGHTMAVYSMCYKSGELFSGSKDLSIKIWDFDSGKCKMSLKGHTGWIMSLKVTENKELLSGSQDKSIKIWNILNGELIRTLEGHSSWIWCVQLIGEKYFLSSSADKSIKIWNLSTGECVKTLEGHNGEVIYVHVDFKNFNLISASSDRTIKIWE